MKCLDTTFIIDFLKGKKEAVAKASKLDKEGELFTTDINSFEVLYGIFKNKNINQEKELRDAQNLLERLTVLPLQSKSTLRSAQIAGELTLQGLDINPPDCITAGICLANDINVIITRDKLHFSRIKGIKTDVY